MAGRMRCFVRLPSGTRPKILMVSDGSSLDELKDAACARLGISAHGCSVLLGSNAGIVKVDLDTAPEIEAMDEVSPDDVLIIVPSSDEKAAASSDADSDEAEHECDAEVEDGAEDEVEIVLERSRQSTLDESVARAQFEGRVVELDDETPVIAGAASATVPAAVPTATPAAAPPTKRPREPKPSRPPKPTLEAVLDEADAAAAPGATGGEGGGEGEEREDSELIKIKERIRKMLSRGLHSGTPEAEAASSMRLAEKLLSKHNLRQADVLKEDHVRGHTRARARARARAEAGERERAGSRT